MPRPAREAASRRARSAAVVGALFVVGATASGAACNADEPDLFVVPADAGHEADVTDETAPPFDPMLGGPCAEDAQCDDGVPCTFDRCDMTLSRCRHTPDDTQCDDGVHCNGREHCHQRLGCQAGPVVTCQDDNPCTIDRCLEATKSCEHGPRDLDGDGDPDDHCVGSRDCDDLDPNVSSLRAEVCGNGRDDDCDGQVDESDCVEPAHDTCATALAVGSAGTYLLSTLATKKDYATSCTVPNAASARDVVIAITVPGAAGDPPVDVEVWPTTDDPAPNTANPVAVALQATCGDAASEVTCHAGAPSEQSRGTSARAIARSVAAGSTVYAIVTTQTEGSAGVKVDMRAGTSAPTNESCAAPLPVALDTPVTVSLIDAARNLPSECETGTGELTYAFTLDQPSDVRVYASTLLGPGRPVVTLRDASCTGERRCRAGSAPPAFARNLPAGTHVFAVSATEPIDASVLVKTSPPSVAPPTQSCATAPPIEPNSAVTVDLSNHEDAIRNGCFGGGLTAAYTLTLTEPSDVLVVGRFPLNDRGAVSFNLPGCEDADLLRCSGPAGRTPQRVSLRNVPAGSYRVVIADELGQTAQLSVYVRSATAPVTVTGGGGCASPRVIGAQGGFFVGDTSTADANVGSSCDAQGQSLTGARDQLLSLVLTERRRVVLDTIGSSYQTILGLRRGPGCPGTELPGGCFVGFGASRSFLDVLVDPGSYFVQVDGYAGQSGNWNLDVRVLPP